MTYTITRYVVAEFSSDAEMVSPDDTMAFVNREYAVAKSLGESGLKVYKVEYDLPIFAVRACS
jgi:hypothetical protein